MVDNLRDVDEKQHAPEDRQRGIDENAAAADLSHYPLSPLAEQVQTVAIPGVGAKKIGYGLDVLQ